MGNSKSKEAASASSSSSYTSSRMDNISMERKALGRVFSDASAEPIKLSYELLRVITENFSNEIGYGGFGVVYMGHIVEGHVAVKNLTKLHLLHEKKFLDEITCLIKAKHRNIVRILGYCSQTEEQLMENNGKHIMAEIQKKLLCFEYVPNGNVQRYLKQETPHRDNWDARYQMIVGICQGLGNLHEKHISHLDLKPENVMLDADMNPKITDFGVSRCLDQGKTVMTENIYGTQGYIAREIIDKGEISLKSDIYSLGIITIQLLSGTIKVDFDNWDKLLDEGYPRMSGCIKIARKCMNPDKDKRPTAREIIRDLEELESINMVTSTVFPGNELLDVCPRELKFSFVPNKKMHSHLTVINKTDCIVWLIIIPGVPGRYSGQFHGILPGMCTGVVLVERHAEEELPSGTDELEIVLMVTGSNDVGKVGQQVHKLRGASCVHKLMAGHELLGYKLHRTMFTAVVVPPDHDDRALVVNSPCKEEDCFHSIDCVDIHPTEPWVAVFVKNRNSVYIWNWQTNKKIGEYKSGVKILGSKFISRKQWVVLGNLDGDIILVCTCMNEVTRFKAHSDQVAILAVHPTLPFLLSCNNMEMKIWDWNNNWSCIGKFDTTSQVTQVMFNPRHTNDFAAHGHDGIVTMWRTGHHGHVGETHKLHDMYGVSNFFTYIGDKHLIADITRNTQCMTVKVWDLQEKKHVYTLQMDEGALAGICHPTRPILVTASNSGSIHIWDSNTYRLKKVYENCPKDPIHMGFTGSKRLVIAHRKGISVLDIDLE